jgi:hypothetical protein
MCSSSLHIYRILLGAAKADMKMSEPPFQVVATHYNFGTVRKAKGNVISERHDSFFMQICPSIGAVRTDSTGAPGQRC